MSSSLCRRGLAAAALAASLALGAAPAQDGRGIPAHPRELKYPRLDFTPPVAARYRQILAGGVIAYMVEDHDLPLVNVSVMVRTGAYLEPAGKEGLAAAAGSQLRSGGAGRWTAEAFDEEADFLAANISSFVGSTSGGASANFLSKDVERALELFFAMLRQPAFQQDRLDLFRSQHLQMIERRNDSTESIEGREWNRLLRGDKHYTSRPSTRTSIESLTRDDLVAFHRKYFQPSNFILAVSGDFQTADMKARLERAISGWPGSGEPVPPVPKPGFEPVPGIYVVDKPDANQGRVTLGHLAIMRGNPDEFALEVMNEILGGADFSSRITNRVRSDEGLAYSARSSFGAGVYYEGGFEVEFQSKSATVAQAARLCLDEIERMRREQVSPEELETIKNNLIEVFPRYFASAAAVAGTCAADEFTRRPPDYWQRYRDRIRGVTAADVLRVARAYLHPDKLVVLVVGNVEDVLKGNPDRPEYRLDKLIPGAALTRIPLPDPATMVYPR